MEYWLDRSLIILRNWDVEGNVLSVQVITNEKIVESIRNIFDDFPSIEVGICGGLGTGKSSLIVVSTKILQSQVCQEWFYKNPLTSIRSLKS